MTPSPFFLANFCKWDKAQAGLPPLQAKPFYRASIVPQDKQCALKHKAWHGECVAGKEERKQQALDSNDSNLKMLWQLTVILLMIGFNGLEGDTDFHAFLSIEKYQKKKLTIRERKKA